MSADVRWALAGATVFVVAVGAAGTLLGRIDAVDVVLVVAVLWLLADRVGLRELFDDTRADLDQVQEDVVDVKVHLTGMEEPSTGRHADGQPAGYRAVPRLRRWP